MTITKMEHIEALIETLQMYAPQIEYGRGWLVMLGLGVIFALGVLRGF